jgi:hypothetical protein
MGVEAEISPAPQLPSDEIRHKNRKRPPTLLDRIISMIEPEDFDPIPEFNARREWIGICTIFYPDELKWEASTCSVT